MSVVNELFHRATIQRNSVTETDGYGHLSTPSWSDHILSLPCKIYNNSAKYITDSEKVGTVEILKMAYRIIDTTGNQTDVTDADRISIVRDRKGKTLYTGNFEIKNITRKYDHYEADLKKVQ